MKWFWDKGWLYLALFFLLIAMLPWHHRVT